jgi:hypothetical protein
MGALAITTSLLDLAERYILKRQVDGASPKTIIISRSGRPALHGGTGPLILRGGPLSPTQRGRRDMIPSCYRNP